MSFAGLVWIFKIISPKIRDSRPTGKINDYTIPTGAGRSRRPWTMWRWIGNAAAGTYTDRNDVKKWWAWVAGGAGGGGRTAAVVLNRTLWITVTRSRWISFVSPTPTVRRAGRVYYYYFYKTSTIIQVRRVRRSLGVSAAVSRDAVALVCNEPETSFTLKSIEVCRTKPDCTRLVPIPEPTAIAATSMSTTTRRRYYRIPCGRVLAISRPNSL